jgi:hypothetical protein
VSSFVEQSASASQQFLALLNAESLCLAQVGAEAEKIALESGIAALFKHAKKAKEAADIIVPEMKTGAEKFLNGQSFSISSECRTRFKNYLATCSKSSSVDLRDLYLQPSTVHTMPGPMVLASGYTMGREADSILQKGTQWVDAYLMGKMPDIVAAAIKAMPVDASSSFSNKFKLGVVKMVADKAPGIFDAALKKALATAVPKFSKRYPADLLKKWQLSNDDLVFFPCAQAMQGRLVSNTYKDTVCIQLPDGKEGLYPAAITQIFDIRAHVYAGDEQTDIKNAASAMQLDYGVLMCVRLREGKTLTSEQWQELGKSFAQSRQASLKMRYDTFLVSDTLQKNNFVEKVGPSDSDWAWSIKIHPGVIDAQSLLSILQAKRFDDERVKQMQDFSATIFDQYRAPSDSRAVTCWLSKKTASVLVDEPKDVLSAPSEETMSAVDEVGSTDGAVNSEASATTNISDEPLQPTLAAATVSSSSEDTFFCSKDKESEYFFILQSGGYKPGSAAPSPVLVSFATQTNAPLPVHSFACQTDEDMSETDSIISSIGSEQSQQESEDSVAELPEGSTRLLSVPVAVGLIALGAALAKVVDAVIAHKKVVEKNKHDARLKVVEQFIQAYKQAHEQQDSETMRTIMQHLNTYYKTIVLPEDLPCLPAT